MNGHAALETAFLKRIIAFLLAFAGIADRVSAAPLPIRAVVLAILRRGEPVIRDFIMGELYDAGIAAHLPVPPIAQPGNEPADALWLGMCFRWLALALSSLLALVYAPHAAPNTSRMVPLQLRLPSTCPIHGFVTPQFHDTS